MIKLRKELEPIFVSDNTSQDNHNQIWYAVWFEVGPEDFYMCSASLGTEKLRCDREYPSSDDKNNNCDDKTATGGWHQFSFPITLLKTVTAKYYMPPDFNLVRKIIRFAVFP